MVHSILLIFFTREWAGLSIPVILPLVPANWSTRTYCLSISMKLEEHGDTGLNMIEGLTNTGSILEYQNLFFLKRINVVKL